VLAFKRMPKNTTVGEAVKSYVKSLSALKGRLMDPIRADTPYPAAFAIYVGCGEQQQIAGLLRG